MDGVSLAELLPPPGAGICIHGPDGEWSADRLRDHAFAWAEALDISPGTAVGAPLPNGGELIGRIFGTWLAGGVYVPLNPRATTTEIQRIERDVLSTTFDPEVAVVSFTSGTTGPPKPVPLLHARVLEGIDQVLNTLRARPPDPSKPPMPNLVPVSLGLWNGIYQVLFAFRTGAPVVLMDRFATAEFAELVARFGIRSTVLPPAAMVMLSDDASIEDLAPLKYVRSISAPLSPLQARRFRERFDIRILNGWGQTELGGEVVGWSAADSKEFGDDKLGAVGRPHAGVEVTTDRDTGELLVRIPGRIDHWHQTGDIGRIDDDGFVWIEGRVSDMINRGGNKVHPSEVEEVLRLSPSLTDAAVVGAPDDRLGEVPVAFIVETTPVADHTLIELCRQHLVPYKVPVRFERIAGLPRNENGKVLKRDLLVS
jgi:long-chain acyl-CoA synthetase